MALVDDYEAAVRSGKDPAYTNYLAQILASQAGININTNQITAATADILPGGNGSTATASNQGFWGGLSWGSALDAIGQGIWHFGDTVTGKNTAQMNADAISGKGPVSSAVKAVTDAASGTSSALKFITDIPRVATTILGLILIIAGIFALARGPAVQIVGAVVKDAVIS